MGEIRFVGPGETRGYPYLVCKKRLVGPGETRGYPYPVCKKIFSSWNHSRKPQIITVQIYKPYTEDLPYKDNIVTIGFAVNSNKARLLRQWQTAVNYSATNHCTY